MTQTSRTYQPVSTAPSADRRRRLQWGLPALAGAAAVSIYGVYGDQTLTSSQQASQEAALPWIIAAAAVVTALLFGLGVPRLLRSRTVAGWGLALGIVGLAAVAVFWSGLPVVFGAAALLLGMTARRTARLDGGPARLATAAVIIGGLAVLLDLAAVLGVMH